MKIEEKDSKAARLRMSKQYMERLKNAETLDKMYYIQIEFPPTDDHTEHKLNQVKLYFSQMVLVSEALISLQISLQVCRFCYISSRYNTSVSHYQVNNTIHVDSRYLPMIRLRNGEDSYVLFIEFCHWTSINKGPSNVKKRLKQLEI